MVVVAAPLGLLAVTLGSWMLVMHADRQSERRNNARAVLTSTILRDTLASVELYRLSSGGGYPAGTPAEVLGQLKAADALLIRRSSDDTAGGLDRAESQVYDAWGRPFCWVIRGSGEAPGVYSVGKNGIDEGGAGDDLQFELDPETMTQVQAVHQRRLNAN